MRHLVRALCALLAAGVLAGGAVAPADAGRRVVGATEVAAASPGNFTGHGFDQCLAPTQKAMDRWWRKSPYTAIGIYVSGDSRACRVQPNLSPTWIAAQVATGWRLLPIALGPQASCQPRFPRYKDDVTISPKKTGGYATALAQGAAEADKNAADAAALGIGAGSTIWYDLEGFDIKNTACRESALRFVSGWVTRIKQHGYVAGFYSSASSGIAMLDDARRNRPGRFALPDRIWIARWDGVANTSTSYIPEDGWRPGGRMKQFQGGHNETWGRVTINIDRNFLDLGAGSTSPGESHCGGVQVGFWRYPVLKPGKAKASRVRALQCLLTEQGLHSGAIDGDFAATLRAVHAWQSAHGFAPKNRFTRRHWVALLAGGGGSVTKYGATGDPVYRLQRALNAAKAGRFKATGVFDAKTEAAVKAYQRALRLPVSGAADPTTWRKLRKGTLR